MGVKHVQNKHPRPSKIACLFLFVVGASVMFAQLPTATILGVVKDNSGAVVPGASLTAKNVETGQTRTIVSGADGSYRFAALPVGGYELLVEHPGFQSQERSGVTLAVAQEAVVNIALQVGAVEQTVAVTAEAPLVNTTSGSLGGLVSEEKVSDLPLNGRNYIDLTLLQPGINENRALVHTAATVGTWFSSNGAPLRSNNFLLDGAIMQNSSGATASSVSGSTLGVEGIREWRVITNSFSAEYGMTMGSQTTIVTKSGTNSFHGSAFEFLRNNTLDARNFFDRQTAFDNRRLPQFQRNNFGGSGGGPLRKDKMFFFLVYEGVRERKGETLVTNTIPASVRVDGALVPQIDPRIKPLLTLFPQPNLAGSQLTFPFKDQTREDFGQGRLDYTISQNDSWFGRYTITDSDQTLPQTFPQFKDVARSTNQYATVSETHIFSPIVLNIFRSSYSRTLRIGDSPSGISGPGFSFLPGQEVGNINIGGVSQLGPNFGLPQDARQNIFTWSDDLYYARGVHSLKFGTLINRYQYFTTSALFGRGQFNFPDISSFLRAQPSVFTAITPGSVLDRTYHYTTLGFYMQDDWRARSNLTFNFGVRYEFNTVPDEVTGRGATIRDLRFDASTTLGPIFENPSLSNVSPRFGFAWDVRGDGKTAVRGGFAVLYDIANIGSALAQTASATPPFSSRSTVAGPAAAALFNIPFSFPQSAIGKTARITDFHIQQPYLMQYNLAVERQLPFDMALTVAYAGSRGINLFNSVEGNPTVPQILPDGRKFFPVGVARINPNFDTLDLKTAPSNSWYNSLQLQVLKRVSKGLQFQSSYTFSRLIDTTQSQLGTPGESQTSNTRPSDPSNIKLDKGLAVFDVEHNWRLNAIYRLPELAPGAGALGKLLNGWWTSGILSLQSGLPFTPLLQANRSRSGVDGGSLGVDRPNLRPGRNNDNIILGGADRYFDPSAFELQPAGFLGNAGRNILKGPGLATLDFSIAKDTAVPYLGEGGKIEFRAEFFNITNRVNLSAPGLGILTTNNGTVVFAGTADGQAPLPTAGRITTTTTKSRQIQFSLKVLF